MFLPCWWRSIGFDVRLFVVLKMAGLGYSTIPGAYIIRASSGTELRVIGEGRQPSPRVLRHSLVENHNL
jgi:hypothetical protein